LHYFSSRDKLESHNVDCREMKCAIRLPNDDEKWLNFSNHRREWVPFIIYADLECTLEKSDSDLRGSQHHRIFSIEYYVQCSYDESLSYYFILEFSHDKDCVAWFAGKLQELAYRVKSILSANVLIETLSSEQWEIFRNATQSRVREIVCVGWYTRLRLLHLTDAERYRGPAQSNCNLNYKDSYYSSVVLHNLSDYDAHFIKEIAIAFEDKIDLIPITKGKYISFTKHVKDTVAKSKSRTDIKLRFIDLYKFLIQVSINYHFFEQG